MRKYLERKENGIYYISEGYNDKQMQKDGFSNIVEGISTGRKKIRLMGKEFANPVYAIKWMGEYAIYAACERENISELKGYSMVSTPEMMIGKSGMFWNKYTLNILAG